MSRKLGKPNMPPSQPRKDKERETREAIVQDADKTEGKDRDLVHGDGAQHFGCPRCLQGRALRWNLRVHP